MRDHIIYLADPRKHTFRLIMPGIFDKSAFQNIYFKMLFVHIPVIHLPVKVMQLSFLLPLHMKSRPFSHIRKICLAYQVQQSLGYCKQHLLIHKQHQQISLLRREGKLLHGLIPRHIAGSVGIIKCKHALSDIREFPDQTGKPLIRSLVEFFPERRAIFCRDGLFASFHG